MKHPFLFGYQLLAGVSDTSTGALLMAAPVLTLSLMGLHAPADAAPFLSFIGAFVLAVGLSYLYGGLLIGRAGNSSRLEAVWLLTAIIRSAVAVFVLTAVLEGALQAGWLAIAAFDAACVLVQAVGLRKGWLLHVAS
ncbi:MAG: hypothetical protein WAM85_02380 [Terracidiphilus sp.]